MLELEADETELVGQWLFESGRMRADAVCERIAWLVAHALKRVAVSLQSGAWETLFQDPRDGRFWERTYPHGDLLGGGPPSLRELSFEAAQRKYLLHG